MAWHSRSHRSGRIPSGTPPDLPYRGFSPGKVPNPKGYRNLPDYEMAMRVKEKTGLPMLLDPSHIGGSCDNVLEVCSAATAYDFDGYIIEVHCDPVNAKTDAKQQLNPHQFHELLKIVRGTECNRVSA